MTVYEMIQKLSEYEAGDEIVFHVEAEYSEDIMAEFDRKNENDTQEITVNSEFDDDVDFDDIERRYYNKKVAINLRYY